MTRGEKIKEARERAGLSQTSLADKISVSKQTMYKYENGIITNIPSDKVALIAKFCNVTPAYLMGWNEASNSQTKNGISEIYEQLSDSNKERILSYAKFLLSEKED